MNSSELSGEIALENKHYYYILLLMSYILLFCLLLIVIMIITITNTISMISNLGYQINFFLDGLQQ